MESHGLLRSAKDHPGTRHVNETGAFQRGAGLLCVASLGSATSLAYRYPSYEATGGGMDWGSRVWGYHPLFMTLAFVCFTVGALVFRFPLPWLAPQRRKAVHGLAHLGALVFGSVGLVAVWRSHGLAAGTANGANLYSMHGWFGFATFCLALFQSATAIVLFSVGVASDALKAAALPPHRALGRSILVFWASAIATGVVEKNGFLGTCSYTVDDYDWNPASHYTELPAVCRTGMWLGMMAMWAAVFATVALS